MKAETYDSRFWNCRDYGHAWEVKSCFVVGTRPLIYERTFYCLRGCDTLRKERFVAGALDARNYGYDLSYKLPGISRRERSKLVSGVRVANLRRTAVKPKHKKERV